MPGQQPIPSLQQKERKKIVVADRGERLQGACSTLTQVAPPGWQHCSRGTAHAYLTWYLFFGDEGLDAEGREQSPFLAREWERFHCAAENRHILTKEIRQQFPYFNVRSGFDMIWGWLGWSYDNKARTWKQVEPSGRVTLGSLDEILIKMARAEACSPKALHNLDPRGWIAYATESDSEKMLREVKHLADDEETQAEMWEQIETLPEDQWWLDWPRYYGSPTLDALLLATMPKGKSDGKRRPRVRPKERDTKLKRIPSRFVRYTLDSGYRHLAEALVDVIAEDGDPRAQQLADLFAARPQLDPVAVGLALGD